MWTIIIPQVNRRWHKRWAYHALHWIFITRTVTAKCWSCVCEVISFIVRKNSLAALKVEQAAWGHNFNEVVLNETLKTYCHTAIIPKHAMEVSVRAQTLFYLKAISYVWRWWVGVFWESSKSIHKTDLPLQQYYCALLFLQKTKNNPMSLVHVTWLRDSLIIAAKGIPLPAPRKSLQSHRCWVGDIMRLSEKKVELSLTVTKESQHCLVNAGTRTYWIAIEGVPTVGRHYLWNLSKPQVLSHS